MGNNESKVSDLEAIAAEVNGICNSSKSLQEKVAKAVSYYTSLTETHKKLKVELEESQAIRRASEVEQRSEQYALLLINGDNYIFKDKLVNDKMNGGRNAALLIRDALSTSLRKKGLHCGRLVVRVYADVAHVSQELCKLKLVGREKRSLSPFIAGFNQNMDLFDFVDSGDFIDATRHKIRATLHAFVEDTRCHQIYLAACHERNFLHELMSVLSHRDKITLVRTGSFCADFARLGFPIEEFPGVFRDTKPEFSLHPDFLQSESVLNASTDSASTSDIAEIPRKVCSFHKKGNCIFGATCRNLHLDEGTSSEIDKYTKVVTIAEWRTFQLSPKAGLTQSNVSSDSSSDKSTAMFTDQIEHPKLDMENIPPGQIPINSSNHRLDQYIESMGNNERIEFQKRVSQQKLCYNHHLHGTCSLGAYCAFDHRPISKAIRKCLDEVAHERPCTRKGACRLINCSSGHHCQNVLCRDLGTRSPLCKMPHSMHIKDTNVAKFVSGYRMPLQTAIDQDD